MPPTFDKEFIFFIEILKNEGGDIYFLRDFQFFTPFFLTILKNTFVPIFATK